MTANPNYRITMRENGWTVGVTAEGRPFALVATEEQFVLALGEVGQHEDTMMLAVIGHAPYVLRWDGGTAGLSADDILGRYLAAVVIV